MISQMFIFITALDIRDFPFFLHVWTRPNQIYQKDHDYSATRYKVPRKHHCSQRHTATKIE